MNLPRIELLPPELVGKIAAGEVVERPASVVKELVENSLDAGATRIVVELQQGGRESIRVVDDGCGIVTEDLSLVFARHATSKLHSEHDLEQIRSLGFRGEALAAVGSVAWVRLQSRTAASDIGGQITCEAGVVSAVEPWAGPVGTCVEVRRLFFNTPARRKFLRSAAAELGHITETLQRLALAFPGVHFRLLHHDRQVLDIPASWQRRERIANLHGEELAERLLQVDYSRPEVSVTGWVSPPDWDRPSARWQYWFVNQRFVRDRTLSHALQEAYRGYLMVGRQPLAFLFLELPPDRVDVNVHPTKIEVRFRDPQLVYQAVLFGVRQALQRASVVPSFSADSLCPSSGEPSRTPSEQPLASSQTKSISALPIGAGTSPLVLSQTYEGKAPEKYLLSRPVPSTTPSLSQQGQASFKPVSELPPQTTRSVVSTGAITSAGSAGTRAVELPVCGAAPNRETPEATLFPTPPELRAMQLHNTYLVAETPDGLLLIDQHALHERILYEQFRSQVQAGSLPKQALLIPEPVDLTASQAALVLEHRQNLETVGLEVSEFGGTTVLVHAVPSCWKRTVAELLLVAAEYLSERDRIPEPPILLDDLLKRMACRSAVKAGDPLRPDEITYLLEQRQLLGDVHHCPHGRPTALFLSKHDLERQFGRA